MGGGAPTLAFIGLGQMGSAIAERLMEKGSLVAVCDPSDAAAAPFLAAGVHRAQTGKEAADRADIVLACLPSAEVSFSIALGPHGVISGERAVTYVEMSTVGPKAVRMLDSKLGAKGLRVLDCPVSGGPRAAREGVLSLIVSGSDEVISGVQPVLQSLSTKLFRVGQVPGQAQLGKLVNNALSLVGMGLAAEAMVVGVKAGLDAEPLLEAINASTGRNSATLDKFPRSVLTRTFDYGGPLGAAVKDLDLFLTEAEDLDIATPIVSAGRQLWNAAAQSGDPQRDFTRVVQTVEQAARVEIVGSAGRNIGSL